MMNEDGSLTELTLKCAKWHLAKIQNLKLDFPPTTSNIFIYETSMTRHTKKWRQLWNLSTYQLMKIDLIQVSTSKVIYDSIKVILIKKTDEGYPLTFVLQWHQKIPLIKWDVEIATVKHNNNVQKDGVYARWRTTTQSLPMLSTWR